MAEIPTTLLSTGLAELPAAATTASHALTITEIAGVAFGCVGGDIFELHDFSSKGSGACLAGWMG